MELFCGKVQRAITGRRNPYPGIDRFLLQCCQWQHLLWKFPQLGNSQAVELNRDHQLMIPQSTLDVSQALRNKLATYLMRKFAVDRDVVQQYLPDELVQWAKVRLPHRGDTLQAAQGTARPAERDMSYIRFLHAPRPEFPKIVRYGQLQHLIDVDIGESRLQLAVIKPCKKEGQPAPPCSAITFKELTAIELVELSALEGVVGRVKDSRERCNKKAYSNNDRVSEDEDDEDADDNEDNEDDADDEGDEDADANEDDNERPTRRWSKPLSSSRTNSSNIKTKINIGNSSNIGNIGNIRNSRNRPD
ncbi:hypothetical protein CALVIDRAFT_569973 [Calocera viscosa TUFC12733]|uniref:Uncharacterized protein n=1 Tax=Calocera viscosa (strain TUFC12733) TaxID=1330018 RepID=A0A167FD94_CALVF|nr:hypothetical protein CALVIDRAFT_569973 [Calocera viscosa TUFC12733]